MRCCIDKEVPEKYLNPNERAVTFPEKYWKQKQTIRIKFLEGTAQQRTFVYNAIKEWEAFLNLNLTFVIDGQSEIRVTFDQNDGAWSYIGTDALRIPQNEATLNLGWVDKSVVLHEFGHAFGMGHEHQNPLGGIKWNEQAVIKDLSGPPNNWNLATIRHNVLDRYSKDQTNGTEVDPLSIMMYPFPATWTLDGFSSKENKELSQTDKRFMASVYPKTTDVEEPTNPPKQPVDWVRKWFPTEKLLYAVKKETLVKIAIDLECTFDPKSKFSVIFEKVKAKVF